MKFLIILIGLALGLFMGLYPGIDKPRPVWWQWSVVTGFVVFLLAALYPPSAGTFADAVAMHRLYTAPETSFLRMVPVHAVPVSDSYIQSPDGISLQMHSMNDARIVSVRFPAGAESLALRARVAHSVVINVERDATQSDMNFIAHALHAENPILTYPFIPQLRERARNLYFHVPLSWVATLAYFVAMLYGWKYLKTRNAEWDMKSASSAGIGTMFALLATVTGTVWARFDWGTFWNWDPRQTSIFIVFMIYGAYFALRSAIDDESQRARLSAVYAIFAFVTVPFLFFIMPRLMDGLHPGSAGSENAGPVVSPQADALHPLKQIVFSASLGLFTILFFWILGLTVRIRKLAVRVLP
jgi:heme exporter protein C